MQLSLPISDDLAKALVTRMANTLEGFIPQGVAQALWSLFKLRYVPEADSLKVLSAQVIEFLPSFELEMAVLTVRALRAFEVPPDER